MADCVPQVWKFSHSSGATHNAKGRARILLDASFRFVLALVSFSISFASLLFQPFLRVDYETVALLLSSPVLLRKFHGIALCPERDIESEVRKGKYRTKGKV